MKDRLKHNWFKSLEAPGLSAYEREFGCYSLLLAAKDMLYL